MGERNRLFTAVLMVVLAASSGCVVATHPPTGAGQRKVVVCHKGKTLEVASPAADAHFRHGDTSGPCR
ncbi:MAG: hypothetical protein OES32_09910 [Acidobacteriota bacterium]|nr:hypothetical protein [Acidobacteriota bacterium]MDH3523889.1 hypothetical protein [Acidobacteriota bacterium]